MVLKVSNNARGYLATGITEEATEITLTAGTGAKFPTLTDADDFFHATIVSVTGNLEIVKVTARSGDVLTVTRGAEGTTPLSFLQGSLVEVRVTAAILDSTAAVLDDVNAALAGALAEIQPASTLFKEYRPGDSPSLFALTGATETVDVDGKAVQFTGAGSAYSNQTVALESGDIFTYKIQYRRIEDSTDPANDGVTAGIDWYNGAGTKISEQILHSNNNLTTNSGLVEFSTSVARAGVDNMDVYAPEAARYALVWFKTYGNNHKTNLHICGLIEKPEAASPVVTAEDLVIPPDFQWPAGTIPAGAGVSDPYSVARTFYVTMDGSDANTGTSLSAPLATVGAGLTKAAALGEAAIVVVHPGEYTVQPDTEIPANCALYGYDLRVTKLSLPAGQEENNMFLMNSGIKVRGFTFSGLQHEAYTFPDAPPVKGYAFVFKPGALIIRSPYIADCSQLHAFTQDQMTLPVDRDAGNPLMPRGGGNIYADGSVLAPSSPLRSVVVDSFTAINPNGVGYVMVRNAFVQLVSVFTNWSRAGIWCHDGGQVTIANSNNTFGDYAFVSSGFRNTVQIEDTNNPNYITSTNAADLISQNKAAIIDEVYTQLFSEFVEVQNFTAEQEALTRRDTNTLLTQLEGDFRSGQDRGAQYFVKGLFNWNAEYHFAESLLPVFLRSYDIVKERILTRPGLTGGDQLMLADLITLIKTNVETPPTVSFPSVIEATGQQFSYAGSGVNYNALPYSQRGTGEAVDPSAAILKTTGGRVYATYSTENGDTFLGEDLRIDFERSTIEGQAFSRGVQNITLPLIIGVGG